MSEIVESRWKRVDLHSGSYMHKLHCVGSSKTSYSTHGLSVRRNSVPSHQRFLCEQRRHFTRVPRLHQRARSAT